MGAHNITFCGWSTPKDRSVPVTWSLLQCVLTAEDDTWKSHLQTQWCKFFYQSKCFKQHLSHNFAVLQERVKGIKISQALSQLPYKYMRGTESTKIQELLTRVFWVLASIGSFLWMKSFHFEYWKNSEKWSKKLWKIATQNENFKYQRTFNDILTEKEKYISIQN